MKHPSLVQKVNEIDAFILAINENNNFIYFVKTSWSIERENKDTVWFVALTPAHLAGDLRSKTKEELDLFLASPGFMIEASLTLNSAHDYLIDRVKCVAGIVDGPAYAESIANFISDPMGVEIKGLVMINDPKIAVLATYPGDIKGSYVEKSMLYYFERGMFEETPEEDKVTILVGADARSRKVWAILHTGAPIDMRSFNEEWLPATDYACFPGAVGNTVDEAMRALKYKLARLPRTPEYLIALKYISWGLVGHGVKPAELVAHVENIELLY